MNKRAAFFVFAWGLAVAPHAFGQAQTAPKPQAQATSKPKVDKAAAYYHYAMGHMYADLATQYGNRSQHINQAIDHFQQALKADPRAGFIAEELSDLYIQGGRLRQAVTDAEAALRETPNDLNQRRILGRIYMRMIGDPQTNKINEEMLKRATEQYAKIVEAEPDDLDAWVTLGRLYKIGQNSVDSEKAFKKALALEPENVEALAMLATVYLDLGDAPRAADLLRKVVEKEPNMRTLTSLAGTYEQMREYSLAAETLKRAIELAPEDADLKRALAQNLMLSEQLDQAMKIYQALVAENEKDVQSWLRISQIYRQKHDYENARKASDQARKLDPDGVDILYNEVGLLESEGKIPEAIDILKQVLQNTAKKSYSKGEKDSRSVLLERLGQLYRNNEQTTEAVATFRELAGLDEQFASRASAHIVDTYRQGRDYSKAAEEAESAYKKWPQDRTVVMVRSTVLADMGRVDEAAEPVRKLLDGKDDREIHLALAQLYDKGKKFAEMAKSIDAAEKLSMSADEKESIHFMRGAMYEKMKRIEESEAEFRKVLAINPKSASALNYLGYMLADKNIRVNEAVELIQKALEQDPNNGAYLDSLGWAYYRLGRLDEAEEYLKKAVERVGKDPVVYDHLGDVYFKKDNLKEAITCWENSLAVWRTSPPAELDQAEVAKVQKKLESAKVRQARKEAQRD
jgi:tetratricopeptide (TPR) repeat protein